MDTSTEATSQNSVRNNNSSSYLILKIRDQMHILQKYLTKQKELYNSNIEEIIRKVNWLTSFKLVI